MQPRSQNISSTSLAALTLGILLVPFFAFTHTTGASFEQEVGNYIIDIGYDPAQPTADSPIYFDFALFKRPFGSADFSRVWVRIEKDGVVHFAGGIANPVIGPTTLAVKIPEGNYGLAVRYEDAAGETIVESTFPLVVESGSGSSGLVTFGFVGLVAFILGALFTRFFFIRRT